MQWARYRKKWGPLNAMLRADRGFALVASSMGGGKMEDMMPWPKEEELELENMEPATPAMLVAAMGASPNYNAKRSDD